MAIELNNRTKILAGVGVLVAAGAGAWFFLFEDDAPPPRTVVTTPAASGSKSAPKPAADAAKNAEVAKAADAPKAAGAPAAPADAPAAPAAAAKPAAKPSAKPIPSNPDQLIAEVIEASGLRAQFQTFGRETMLKSDGEEPKKGAGRADEDVMSKIVERVFDPAKMTAEIAVNLKGKFDAERMARFLELLRQPVALKMAALEARPVPSGVVQEFSENFRKNPPPAARAKLIQSIDEVTQASELATELANALARDMADAMLDAMQKAGKNVPKQARQMVGSQLNATRNQARGHFKTLLYITYRDASDEELSEYAKLLDTDTGRWGSSLLAGAIKPVIVSRGSELGKEMAPLAMSRRAGVVAKAPAEPVPEPLPKAQSEAPADKPASSAAAPVEPVGYQRAANIRELYARYNDLISAAVMRDRVAVKELLDDGKFPNARQADGTTPLMIAVSNGDVEIAAMLLAKGADPNLRATGGTTALSIAKARGSAGAELVRLLQSNGAKE